MGVPEAIALASRGFRVFPLHRNGTKPVHEGWTEYASSDVAEVFDLFCTAWDEKGNAFPLQSDPGYNVGVLCDNMLVVDVDTKKGRSGWASFMRFDPDRETFTVETKSGGRHYYYDTAGASFANTSGTLGEGLDTRSYHGYVVGPGSVVDGKEYRVLYDPGVIADPPAELLRELKPPKTKNTAPNTFAYLDDERCIAHAQAVLAATEGCVEGEQSKRTYDVACAMRDCGVSEGVALWLMLDYWNERNSPPLSADDMERRVANAYLYAADVPGNRSPLLHFDGIDTSQFRIEPDIQKAPSVGETDGAQAATDRGQPEATEWGFGNLTPLSDLKPRPWLVNDFLLAGDVTTMSAAGAGGKTTFMLNAAIQLAVGAEEVMGYKSAVAGRPVRSVIHSAEDSVDELARRVHGSCLKYGYDPKQVAPFIALSSGKDRDLKFALMSDTGNPVVGEKAVEQVVALAAQGDVGLIGLDPLANLHNLNENDSVQMTFLMSVFNQLAAVTGAAVLIMHHTHKSSDGSVGSSRGSGAIVNSSRISLVLNPLAPAEGAELGVPSRDIPRVSWIADGKSNMSEKTNKRRWYIMQSVTLWTGDSVGVPMGYKIEQKRSASDERMAKAIREHMDHTHNTALSLKECVNVLRDMHGEDLFLKMSQAEGERTLRQIIIRTPAFLEMNQGGKVVPTGCANIAQPDNVALFDRKPKL